MRPIQSGELQVGQALPFDAYDERGKLLLRAGHVLTSEASVERLVRVAYFDDTTSSAKRSGMFDDSALANRPLNQILSARSRLHILLTDAESTDFPSEIKRITELLRRACQTNADLSLASILLNREGHYATRHMVNVAITCELVGAALELPLKEHMSIMAAALTMNVGMLDLQQSLLTVDGPLNDDQHHEVRQHCAHSVALLREYGVTDELWLQVVLDHHERSDGSGYPEGKRGDAIGLPARLLASADVYCARVTGRNYRPPLQAHIALRRLYLNEGARLDDKVATSFIKTLGIYPPGTGVRLRNGSIAVVTHRGNDSLTPQVSSITTHDGLRVTTPIRRRGDVGAHAISEAVNLDELDLSVSMEALWGADAVT
ncbi:HD-GYP domain-containing protein [Dyella caseinilytica]|uniref:Phosphohydrolase n=1 Tax=Dyella caseinilytica TaxID=1849581 RepID=A0ABX7GYI1_9GAMM|nr:HD domain-containing phosphohydrolase [Dyella caseinilytica]QRN55349.1 phosphohydrolase [Dyella caseinilytica]GGA01081.1 HD family phosphohydrolase [Dyella caseinilytica]